MLAYTRTIGRAASRGEKAFSCSDLRQESADRCLTSENNRIKKTNCLLQHLGIAFPYRSPRFPRESREITR